MKSNDSIAFMTGKQKAWAVAATLWCVPILTIGVCESAIALEGNQVIIPGGYLSDAKDVRENGGVGNYFFRYLRGDKNQTVLHSRSHTADELNYSSQASAIRQPAMTVEENVVFEQGSALLTAEGKIKLDSIATGLRKMPTQELEIRGYADATGTETYNERLSKQRAEAVVRELRRKGVPSAQLQWEGRGIENPIGDNATAEGRAQNRRVEILKQ